MKESSDSKISFVLFPFYFHLPQVRLDGLRVEVRVPVSLPDVILPHTSIYGGLHLPLLHF